MLKKTFLVGLIIIVMLATILATEDVSPSISMPLMLVAGALWGILLAGCK